MNKSIILKEFGRNLRFERQKRGLSQEALAEQVGLSFGQVVGNIERGEVNPSLIAVLKLLNFFDIRLEDLIDIKSLEE